MITEHGKAGVALLALCGSLLVGCAPSSGDGAANTRPADTSSPTPPPNQMDTTNMRVTGTVHSVSIEGGCWRFDADNGTHYEIEKGSAPAGLLTDGKKATLTLKLRPDLMSSCMVGPIAQVVAVE